MNAHIPGMFPPLARLAAIVVLAAGASAETIALRGGGSVTGEVIREYGDRVIVDLGFDLLTVPRDAIVEIRADEQETAAKPRETTRTPDLYSTADLPEESVKHLVDRFGEAVVLVSSPVGLGSGFFTTSDGHLITNFHVIEGETRIAVHVFRKSGREFKRQKIEEVEIVATNPFLDLALLKAELPEGYEAVCTYLADDDRLRDGDHVFAIGNPQGLERSISEGIVSRRNRANRGLAYIQTTTQINPGNSGGPLFNMHGEVIGVTNMKRVFAEGLGFAIPVRYVVDFLKNRDAFAYNSESSEAGFRYLQPALRKNEEPPALLKRD